jgi:16S rRNA (adenine1518-N6/adenine1519-N6)-dimethyltransferase
VITRRAANELLARHNVTPSRALGQNFVVDPNTVRRIARIAGVGSGDHVVEIGAGMGSLTLALAETGAMVTAVETDRYLIPILEEVLADVEPAPRLVHADATTLDWATLLDGVPRWHLVANLPYNVATPLVLDLLDRVPAIDPMLVLVQSEAAERLAASPGPGAYGIPTVKVAYWATASVVGGVSADVFLPRPNVQSALVKITRRPHPATDADFDRLFALVRAGFGQRRKMLRRSLAGIVEPEAFERADIRPDARPEELTVEEWGRLTMAAS